jgi:hypothetical protein
MAVAVTVPVPACQPAAVIVVEWSVGGGRWGTAGMGGRLLAAAQAGKAASIVAGQLLRLRPTTCLLQSECIPGTLC